MKSSGQCLIVRLLFSKCAFILGVVVHVYNRSTRKTEARGQGFKASLG